MIPTFRPWTHTSDDSYIYQLSLVVATATVSFILYPRFEPYVIILSLHPFNDGFECTFIFSVSILDSHLDGDYRLTISANCP